ncbi:hypothetical protein D9M68_42380 [compost metagenome]
MDYAQIITVFGIALPVCATVLAWFWKTHHERKAVKVALIAEILALRDIATIRQYVKELLAIADDLKALPEADRQVRKYQVSVPEHYCRVYIANVSRLGALKLIDANLIVRFYQFADSVIRDVAPNGLLYEGTTDPEDFERNAHILTLAVDIANELERRNPMQGAGAS